MSSADPPVFKDPIAQAILVEQAAIEAELIDIIDLPPNELAVLAFIERLHAQASRCIEFAETARLAVNAASN